LWQHISGITCPPDIQEALAALNPHYFLSRYPGMDIEYDLEAAQEILERMERVWKWLTETANLSTE
jgi:HEPN domain-containing protein